MGLTRLQLRTARAFVLVFLALVFPTVAAPRRGSAHVKTILIFGDSLSDGFRLSRSQAYPALLAKKLGAIGLDYDVINASVSGGTTAGGLERIAAQLTRPIDIFILELGINDAFRGVSVPEIRENLQTLIDRVKAKNPNVRVIVVGMQLPNYSTDDFIRAFGQMYFDLATKNHAGLVPYLLEGVGGNPELSLPDLIHPNAAGHKILTENVWRVLEPIAKETSAGPARNVQ
ncbi:MAG: arylesterase [Verrucomicrobiota bacterium]|nr:arylesterase [Verrucomicrobiota bacterium]